MNKINLLVTCIIFNFFTTIYSMEYAICLESTTRKHILTSKPKKIFITLQEAAHSSTISTMYEKALRENKHNIPIKINYKKEDIILFTKLLHKPSSYAGLYDKEYYSALLLAAHFKAPILYAELLNTKLPLDTIILITQKYLAIHDLPNALINKVIYAQKIRTIYDNYNDLFLNEYAQNKKQRILTDYKEWSDTMELSKQYYPINTITLPQAVLLSLICNMRSIPYIVMKFTPSTSGFNSFISLPRNIQDLLAYLPIEIFYDESLVGNKMLTEVIFKI